MLNISSLVVPLRALAAALALGMVALLTTATSAADALPAPAEKPASKTYKFVNTKIKGGVFSTKLVKIKGKTPVKKVKVGLGAFDMEGNQIGKMSKTNKKGVLTWKVPKLNKQISVAATYALSKKNYVSVVMCNLGDGWKICTP